ncbi:hypothetical protein [Rhizobium oryziradicis]|uniref:Uncharacterized protein n=1 Tax=Rhizobium oryziradicis TaxID=1867956 RepID=A0A1Q8ZQW9_9HYPH|nr:hypothetical protein [Rhizobium oryziradicis]OLP44340.1 hypothetical protein BJF95_07285 [Rhizobium oryziradicis]
MVAMNSMPIPTQPDGFERSLDTVELIDRMAHDLKASSDADLPHCYFVEQAKLRLAGVHTRERAANDAVRTVSKNIVNGPSSVFYAWAMPE